MQVEDGWLIAMHRGEFEGSGLYWLKAGESSAQRLDEGLLEPIRWIVRTSFGVVGVAGLCHGEACTNKTSIYELFSVEGQWKYYPIALFPGCPAAVEEGPGGRSVLIAAACGGLYAMDDKGLHQVATWPGHLSPLEVVGMRGESGTSDVYLVSFGNVAARFTATSSQWYAPRDCPRLVADANHQCACAPVAR